MERAIPVVAQVTMLTSTTFMLMTAAIGPVGPSFKAKKTENSEPRKKKPEKTPKNKFSLLKNSSSGTLITYKPASKTTSAAQIKSAMKFSLMTVREDRILVQYLAMFSLILSMSIEQNPSVIIICRAFDWLYSSIFTSVPDSLGFTEKASMRIPVMQTKDPVKCAIVRFSL